MVELGDEQVRRARRGRRPLRRPRHRQARPPSHRAPRSSTSTSTLPRSASCAAPTCPVVGPLKQILAELATALETLAAAGRASKTGAWLAQLADWREEFPLRYGSDDDVLKPQRVLETLQQLTEGRDDVIWTTGVGQHQMWAMQYLRCDEPRSFITSGGLGTMGYGLPAAVGAKAARPDATVVCVDGDGCFQMTCQELATAVTEELPIVVVIVNNGYLGMVRQWQDMFFEERFSQVRLPQGSPDYAKLAEAYGAVGLQRRRARTSSTTRWRPRSPAAAPPSSTAASIPRSTASR